MWHSRVRGSKENTQRKHNNYSMRRARHVYLIRLIPPPSVSNLFQTEAKPSKPHPFAFAHPTPLNTPPVDECPLCIERLSLLAGPRFEKVRKQKSDMSTQGTARHKHSQWRRRHRCGTIRHMRYAPLTTRPHAHTTLISLNRLMRHPPCGSPRRRPSSALWHSSPQPPARRGSG